MINVALLSRWHVHADDYAREVKANEHLSIQLVWDEDVERGKKWADELGVPFEQDLQSVLSNPSIDAVVVSTPTNKHKEIIIAAANNKKHIFTEKVLAFSVEDCVEIYDAVEAQGVNLMVSLPRLTDRLLFYPLKRQLDDRIQLGYVNVMVRCRLAHNGAVPLEGANTWLAARSDFSIRSKLVVVL